MSAFSAIYMLLVLEVVSGGNNVVSNVYNCDSGYSPTLLFYLSADRLDYRMLDRQQCSVYCSFSSECQAFHSVENDQLSSEATKTFDCHLVPSTETARFLWMKSNDATGYICTKAADISANETQSNEATDDAIMTTTAAYSTTVAPIFTTTLDTANDSTTSTLTSDTMSTPISTTTPTTTSMPTTTSTPTTTTTETETPTLTTTETETPTTITTPTSAVTTSTPTTLAEQTATTEIQNSNIIATLTTVVQDADSFNISTTNSSSLTTSTLSTVSSTESTLLEQTITNYQFPNIFNQTAGDNNFFWPQTFPTNESNNFDALTNMFLDQTRDPGSSTQRMQMPNQQSTQSSANNSQQLPLTQSTTSTTRPQAVTSAISNGSHANMSTITSEASNGPDAYTISSQETSWDDSFNSCLAMSKQLLVINSTDKLVSVIKSFGGSWSQQSCYWINVIKRTSSAMWLTKEGLYLNQTLVTTYLNDGGMPAYPAFIAVMGSVDVSNSFSGSFILVKNDTISLSSTKYSCICEND